MTDERGLKYQIKRLVKHGAVYGIGSITSRIVGFLLLPLYTHFLTPSDYGILQLVFLTTETLAIVISMRLAVTIFRFFYETDNEIERNTVISTALLGVILVATLFLVPLFFLSPWLAELVLADAKHAVLFKISIVSLWMSLSVSIFQNYLQLKERSILFVSISLVRLLLACLLNIYFVAFMKIGVIGILISSLIIDTLSFIVMIPILLKIVGIRFSINWLKRMLRFSLPLVPSSIANEAMHASDRYFIMAFFSLSETGIYALAYKMGNSIHSLFYVSFSQIWNARRFAIAKETDAAPAIYANICTYFIGLMSFVGLGMAIFAQDIIKLIAPEKYWQAGLIMPAIVLCYVVYAIEDHISTGIYLTKKTERYSLMKISSGAANIALNFILIPRYGMYGAVFSTLLTFCIFNAGLYFFGRNLYLIPFEWRRLSLIFFICISMYFVSLLVASGSLILDLLLKTILWFSCPLIMWVTPLITDKEKMFLRELLISRYRLIRSI